MAVEIPKNVINHIDNLSRFTGWKGKNWWENGVCNPRKPLKIGGQTEIKFKK